MVDALSESFDDELDFTKSSTFFVEGGGLQFFGIYDSTGLTSDFDGSLIPPDPTFVSGYSGFTGNFLIANDLDGSFTQADTITLTWDSIDVTGLRDVEFSGLFASINDAAAGPDSDDFIIVEVNVDGGGYVTLLDFRADAPDGEFRLDTNNDGVGDGALLTGAAQSFTASIIEQGASSLDLRLRASTVSPHEDFAVDDFKVTGSVNIAPVAQNDAVATNEATSLNGNVLSNNGSGADSDGDGDTLTVSAVNGVGGNVGSQITLASGALLTVNANGTFSYDPNGQFETLAVGSSDTDSFTYAVSDGFGGSDTATVTITINGVNDSPNAQDDDAATSKNSVLNGNVLVDNGNGADSDIDVGDTLSVSAVNGQAVNVGSQITLTSGALLTVNANGTFSYDPNGAFVSVGVGATTTDSFDYAISDGNGGSDTATATITIIGANNNPVARADFFTTNEDTLVGGNVLNDNGSGADTDPNTGDSISVSEVNGVAASVGNQITLASGALLTVNTNGTFTYDTNGQFETLAVGASDTDSFDYSISDGNGGTSSSTVTITINGVNDGPVAQDDAVSTNKNSILNGNVLSDNGSGADSDIDIGDVLSVSSVNGQALNVGQQITLASGALLTLNSNGTFSYDPNGAFVSVGAGSSTTDNFDYSISDGNGGSDTATASVTITGSNNNPVARPDFFTTDEETVENGNVLNDNGSGADTDPNTGDVITVSAVNGVGANVGNQITLSSGALLTVNSNGTFSYDPNGAFNSLAVGASDTDSFDYTISDGNGGTSSTTATFTINGVNDAPIAQNDAIAVSENTVRAGNVMGANGSGIDFDPDIGDVLTVSTVNGSAGNVGTQITLASGALLTIGASGSYSYNPNGSFETLGAGATTTETVNYTISDGNGGSDGAVITFTITGVNDAPIARNDTVSTGENSVLNGNVFANNGAGADSDIDIGDVLSVSAVNGQAVSVGQQITLASGALLTLNSNGTFSYNPNGQFETLGVGATDTDSFSYTVSDGKGGTDTATATITINGVNDAPIARNDAVSVGENSTLNGNVLLNNGGGIDSDIDIGDVVLVSAVNGVGSNVGSQITLVSGALLTVNANGTFTYNPNGQFETLGVGATDTDSFAYTVSDGKGGTDTATATVTITGVNDAPIARNDSLGAGENTVLNGNIFNNNGSGADSDIDIGDILNVSAVNGQGVSVGSQITLTSGALLTLNANGTFSYDANGQFETLGQGATDTDSFFYTISDGKGGTDTATATVTITGANDAPIARNDALGTNEETIKSGSVFNNNGAGVDSDIDIGDSISVSAVNGVAGNVGNQFALGSGALLLVNASGTIFYNPNGSFESLGEGVTDTDTFTYQTSDGKGGFDTATVTFTITGVNDAPIAFDDAVGVSEDVSLNADLLANNGAGADSDIDIGDILTVLSVNGQGANVGSQITLASGAFLTVNANGTFTYNTNGQFETLGAGVTDTETFNYVISDGKGGTDNATATVTITGVNDGPIARNDSFTVAETSSFGGNVMGDNGSGADTDIDIGDILNVSAINGQAADVGSQITLASGALLTVNANGTLSYDPNGAYKFLVAGDTDIDSFTYTISDGKGGFQTATVTVDILGEFGGLFVGTANSELINSTIYEDTIEGLDGNDTLNGLDDNDFINGGFGDDQANGGTGADTVNGSAGNDTIDGGLGNDVLNGGDGDDDFMFANASGDDTVSGGLGFDRLIRSFAGAVNVTASDTAYTESNGGDNLILSSLEHFRFTAGGGADNFDFSAFSGSGYVAAGGGNDDVTSGLGNDEIFGQGGADTLRGHNGNDTLSGGNQNDFLYGDSGLDELFGGSGDDSLFGGLESDILAGGDGADSLAGEAGNDELFGGGGNDTVSGGEGGDTVTGVSGEDLVTGGGGNDSLLGGLDNDTVSGDDGNDTVSGNQGSDEVSGGSGSDTVAGGDDNDMVFGNDDDDLVAGTLGDDTVDGGDGDDTVLGGDGNDSLFGDIGADEVFGGIGEDTLDGEEGNDLVAGAAGNDLLTGNVGDDTVFGGDGADIVIGGDGDDSLLGNVGVDQLFGGLDNDTLNGGSGDDLLAGNAGNDLLQGGQDNDSLLGGEGADELLGGDGIDTLVGDFGNDTLNGGTGDDTLLGGSGNDNFVFNPGTGDDEISDFVAGPGVGDVITLLGFGAAFDSFADVQAAAIDDGFGNTIINLGGGDSIFLLGRSVSDLAANDFLFG